MFYSYHIALLYLCCSTAGLVFIILVYSMMQSRQSKKTIHFHTRLISEAMWTIIPLIILVALAAPAIIQFLHYSI